MRNIYFIDYENVGPKGLNGIDNLTSNDEVYFFHYIGTGEVKYDNLLNLATTRAKTQIIRLSTHDKNAMDFQIVAMLGLLVGKYEEKATYNIVSKDKGYLSAIECLKATISANLKVRTIPTICGENDAESIEAVIKQTLDGKCAPKIINRAINAAKSSKSLQELHENLQRNVSKDVDLIYKNIKPLYKDFARGVA